METKVGEEADTRGARAPLLSKNEGAADDEPSPPADEALTALPESKGDHVVNLLAPETLPPADSEGVQPLSSSDLPQDPAAPAEQQQLQEEEDAPSASALTGAQEKPSLSPQQQQQRAGSPPLDLTLKSKRDQPPVAQGEANLLPPPACASHTARPCVTLPLLGTGSLGSRLHARVWQVMDRGSLNGTMLNNKPIGAPEDSASGDREAGRWMTLKDGDIITAGTTSRVMVKVAEASAISHVPVTVAPFAVALAADAMTVRRGRGKPLPMEDVPLAEWPLRGGLQDFGVFCVFDGHAGRAAAENASRIMPERLSKILQAEERRAAVLRTNNAADVLQQAFRETEEELPNEDEGCTATVLLVWRGGGSDVQQQQPQLYAQAANVGDSHCVFRVGEEHVVLTEDHRLTGPVERARLEAAGKALREGETRLGTCMVTPSLLLGVWAGGRAGGGSDGLWDVMTTKKAAQVAAEVKAAGDNGEYSTAAECVAQTLLERARRAKTVDNTTVMSRIVVYNNTHEKLLVEKGGREAELVEVQRESEGEGSSSSSSPIQQWLYPSKEELPDDVEMSIWDHLEELRGRVLVAVGAVGVAISVCFAFAKDLVIFLEAPVQAQGVKFLQLHPGEYFFTTLKVAGYSGLLIGSPVILYEIIAFVLPGLTLSERRFLGPIVLGSSVLFYAGIAFSYVVLTPAALNFFISYAEGVVESIWSIDQYFEFVLVLMFSTGLSFQVPVIQLLLGQTGIVTSQQMLAVWKYVVVGAVAAAAVLTPSTDPLTQLLLAGPLIGLYMGGAYAVKLLEQPKEAL
eukprot:jgi/Mesen1/1747/ME001390S00740